MLIKVRVKTKSQERKIVLEDNIYKVYVKSFPEKGKANQELIKILSKEFKKKATIIKGLKSRDKVISLD